MQASVRYVDGYKTGSMWHITVSKAKKFAFWIITMAIVVYYYLLFCEPVGGDLLGMLDY